MEILETHIVPAIDQKVRLQEYGINMFKTITTKSALKKAIKRSEILIDGKVADTAHWIEEGQEIHLVESSLKSSGKIFKLKLEVVYEDDFLAVVNKPAGFPTSGNYYKTILNALPFNLKKSSEFDALKSPMPVHRLDGPTSGLLLVAKTKEAQLRLHKQFEEKKIQKKYIAVVTGRTMPEGVINLELDGKTALTRYETYKSLESLRNDWLSLLSLFPETGRTHQLRRHLAAIEHPIVGDTQYGIKGKTLLHKGLFLAAVGLEFSHPILEKQLQLEVAPPSKFVALMEKEYKRFKKFRDT